MTDRDALREQYEATGDPAVFEAAQSLYEEALTADPDDARLRYEYGYLLECRGRALLREAVSQYEHAVDLEPEWAKPRLQLISARAALHETDDAIALYEQRLRDAPHDLDEHRYLAYSYIVAREYAKAADVVSDALKHAPDDPIFIELHGEVLAGTGHTAEALAQWARAHELDPESLSPIYSSVFLLQRERRLEEAAEQWRYIIAWSEEREYWLDAEWPKQELERVLGQIAYGDRD